MGFGLFKKKSKEATATPAAVAAADTSPVDEQTAAAPEGEAPATTATIDDAEEERPSSLTSKAKPSIGQRFSMKFSKSKSKDEDEEAAVEATDADEKTGDGPDEKTTDEPDENPTQPKYTKEDFEINNPALNDLAKLLEEVSVNTLMFGSNLVGHITDFLSSVGSEIEKDERWAGIRDKLNSMLQGEQQQQTGTSAGAAASDEGGEADTAAKTEGGEAEKSFMDQLIALFAQLKGGGEESNEVIANDAAVDDEGSVRTEPGDTTTEETKDTAADEAVEKAPTSDATDEEAVESTTVTTAEEEGIEVPEKGLNEPGPGAGDDPIEAHASPTKAGEALQSEALM